MILNNYFEQFSLELLSTAELVPIKTPDSEVTDLFYSGKTRCC